MTKNRLMEMFEKIMNMENPERKELELLRRSFSVFIHNTKKLIRWNEVKYPKECESINKPIRSELKSLKLYLGEIDLVLETFPTEEKKAKPEPNNVARLLPKESKFDSVREFLQSLAVHEPTGKLIWPYRQSDLKHFTESIIIPYVSNSEPNKFAANYFVWKDGKEFTSEGFGKVKKEAKLSPQTEQIINPVKIP